MMNSFSELAKSCRGRRHKVCVRERDCRTEDNHEWIACCFFVVCSKQVQAATTKERTEKATKDDQKHLIIPFLVFVKKNVFATNSIIHTQ